MNTNRQDMESVSARARWGLHYLDHNPDPNLGWMPFFGGAATGPRPHYAHNAWDACDAGWRMLEAYILARQVVEQAEPGGPEKRLRAFVLSTLREDGLSYRPETPWWRPDAWMWDHGRALIALATWLRLEPTDQVAAAARRMAEGLAAIALREDNYWYYPAENWMGDRWGDTVAAHPPTGLAIEGLVDLARLLGDDRYIEIASHFVRAVTTREPLLFEDDGTVVPMGGGPYDFCFTHLHSRLAILIGLTKYALVIEDDDLLAWCQRAYVYVRDALSSSFGWVPESLEAGTDPGVRDLSTQRRDEVCSISDMMQLASLWAHHGRPEERATIGCYGANQILVHQLVDLAPIRHLIGDITGLAGTELISYEGVPERFLGGFTAGTYPNDLTVDLRSFGLTEHQVDVAGCCSPAGIKALYVLWDEALKREGDIVHVHLLASVENDDVRVDCFEPWAGRLQVTVKQDCGGLAVQLPEHVDEHAASSEHAGEVRNGAVHFGALTRGDEIELTYPLVERTASEELAGSDYQVQWRGGRVVRVLPPSPGGCPPYWWRESAAPTP